MKIEAFLTLNAVLRTGSFAAAAAEMSLTPSAVSMQMKQLEQYLGQTLFDRSGLQIRPHPAAYEVADAIREGLQRMEMLRRRPSVVVEGNARLGIIESLMPALLPGLLSQLRERHPRLTVQPRRGRSTQLINDVKAGHLDAAVVASPLKGPGDVLRVRPLLQQDLVLIAPPDSTDTSPTALLRRYSWIRYDRRSVTGAMASRHVLSLAPGKRGVFEIDSAPAIIAMVSGGLGVSIIHLLDASFCQAYPVREIRLGRHAPQFKLVMVTRKTDDDDRTLSVIHETLLALVKKTI